MVNKSARVFDSTHQILVRGVHTLEDVWKNSFELLGQVLLVVPSLHSEELIVVAGDVAVPPPVLDDIVVGIAQMAHVRLSLSQLVILNHLIPDLRRKGIANCGLILYRDRDRGRNRSIRTPTLISVFSCCMSLAEGSRVPCLAIIQNLTGRQSGVRRRRICN